MGELSSWQASPHPRNPPENKKNGTSWKRLFLYHDHIASALTSLPRTSQSGRWKSTMLVHSGNISGQALIPSRVIKLPRPQSLGTESSSDSKEIKLVSPKGNQLWIFMRRTGVEAEAPTLWPPDAKSQFIRKDPDAGKDWRQEKKRWQDMMVG